MLSLLEGNVVAEPLRPVNGYLPARQIWSGCRTPRSAAGSGQYTGIAW
jgi:hypothetical protein